MLPATTGGLFLTCDPATDVEFRTTLRWGERIDMHGSEQFARWKWQHHAWIMQPRRGVGVCHMVSRRQATLSRPYQTLSRPYSDSNPQPWLTVRAL